MVEDTSTEEVTVELVEEKPEAATGLSEDEFVKLLASLYKQL